MGKVLRINTDGSIPPGQSVRRPRRRAAGDLCARLSRRSRRRHSSAQRQAVAERARAAGRRRDQRGREGQELRLPGDRLRARIHRQGDQRRSDGPGRHGTAGRISGRLISLLPASAFYTGQAVSGMAGRFVRGARWPASISCASCCPASGSWRKNACWSISISASAASNKVPTKRCM